MIRLRTRNSRTPRAQRPVGLATVDLLAIVAGLYIALSIAVPRYKVASTRAGGVRAKADLKAIAGALETYRLDHGAYPPSIDLPGRTRIHPAIYGSPKPPPRVSHRQALIPLTTPMAYLPRVDFDAPFVSKAWEICEAERRPRPRSYWYCNYMDFHRTARGAVAPAPRAGYLILAFGPRCRGIEGVSAPYGDIMPTSVALPCFKRPNVRNAYDPTNGAFSPGNILRFGGRLALEDGVHYVP